MKAGKLNRKVTIEVQVKKTSADGGEASSWGPVATVWAALEPLRGREYHEAGGSQSEVDIRIRIRHRKGIKPAMRVVCKNRVFDIQSVIDIRDQHREIHMMCKEYDNN